MPSKRNKRSSLPPGIPVLLDGMVREVLLNNTQNIYAFLAQHTARLLDDERQGKDPYQKHYTTKTGPAIYGDNWRSEMGKDTSSKPLPTDGRPRPGPEMYPESSPLIGEDGTKTWYSADGSKVQEFVDGTKLISKPDGTRFIVGAQGVRTFKGTDTCMIEVRNDGARSYVGPPSSTLCISHDGKPQTVRVYPDSSLIYESVEGHRAILGPDGEVSGDKGKVLQLPDGTKLIAVPDGTMVQIGADGSKRLKCKDTCLVEVKADGGKKYVGALGAILDVDTDGKDGQKGGHVQVNAFGNIIYTDAVGGVTTLGADGVMSYRPPGSRGEKFDKKDVDSRRSNRRTLTGIAPDGTKTWIAEDDSKVQEFPDGIKLITTFDGTRLKITQDGLRNVKGTDSSFVELRRDGARSYLGPAETKLQISNESGTVVANPRGSIIYDSADGKHVEVSEQGDVSGDKGKILQTPEGTKIVAVADGTRIQVLADGTRKFKGMENTLVEVKPDGKKRYVGGLRSSVQVNTNGKDGEGLVQVSAGGRLMYRDAHGGTVLVEVNGKTKFYKAGVEPKSGSFAAPMVPYQGQCETPNIGQGDNSGLPQPKSTANSEATQTRGRVPDPVRPCGIPQTYFFNDSLAQNTGQSSLTSSSNMLASNLPDSQSNGPPNVQSNVTATGDITPGVASTGQCATDSRTGNPSKNVSSSQFNVTAPGGMTPGVASTGQVATGSLSGNPSKNVSSSQFNVTTPGDMTPGVASTGQVGTGSLTGNPPNNVSSPGPKKFDQPPTSATGKVQNSSAVSLAGSQSSRDRVGAFTNRPSWAQAVRHFFDRNIEAIRRLLTGEMSAEDASDLLPLAVALVVGVVFGYAVKSSSSARRNSCSCNGSNENGTLIDVIAGFLTSDTAKEKTCATAAAATRKCDFY